jgi:SOS response regulatory protein OraA/RecX
VETLSLYRGDRRNDRRNFKLSELHSTLTPHHTTNMSRIEEALAAIESLDEGEYFTYTKAANTYGVSRVTQARRHQGIQASRTEQAVKQQLLNPQQELELVRYITKLTDDGLPPTRDMIQSFASKIIKGKVGNE